MAEGLLEKMLKEKGIQDIEVFSVGTNPVLGEPPAREAIEILRKEGIDISRHRGVYVTYDLISQADLIFAMGKSHKEKILEMDPKAKNKTFLLKEFAGGRKSASPVSKGEENPDVTDPVGQTIDAYKKCLFEIKDALEKALSGIVEVLGDKKV